MGVLFFAKEDGLNPKKVASTKGGEYHSPCPGCGGKDRFIIWDQLNRYFCRQCGKRGDGIQYNRDFHGLSYRAACQKNGIMPKDVTFKDVANKQTTPSFQPPIVHMPSSLWRQKAKSFISYSQEQLRNSCFACNLLFERGFSQESIERFHLGWNPTSLWLKRDHWGLASDGKKLWIPKGLVIPTYDWLSGEPLKLKMRCTDWQEGDRLPKYVEVPGSLQAPALYGYSEDHPIVVVESELDALLLQHCANDLCCVLALGGVSKRPDFKTHQLLLQASVLLLSLDVDKAGASAYRWWREIYFHMKVWVPPVGKSVGDAFLAGIDLREWLRQGIGYFT